MNQNKKSKAFIVSDKDTEKKYAITQGYYHTKFERMAFEKGLFKQDEDFDDADYRDIYRWDDHVGGVLKMIDRCCDDMMHAHKIIYKDLQDFNV